MPLSRRTILKQRQRARRKLLVSYLGYGTSSEVHMRGRVLQDNGITVAKDTDPIWINIRNMIKRYAQRGVPNASVRVRFQGIQKVVATDLNGYFELYFNLEPPLESQDTWFDVEFDLLDYPGQQPKPADEIHIFGKALIPSGGAQFGVISDIDDTVLRTDIGHVIHMITTTFFHNARTRLPFEGVAAFYDALRVGTVGGASNPIYYVSSSPWNLYDLIVDFFVIRGIPIGPLFLIDLGFRNGRFHMPSHYDHKISVIQQLLDTNSKLNFILIGDSGQKDAEIYLEVVRKNPGRIRTIYIRDVTGQKRDRQIRIIIAQVQALGVEMVYIADTLAASNHALEKGYILPHKVAEVAEEREKDKQAPTLVQQLLNPEASESRS
ncbi:MAG: App1 family protein [Aggregatilineales bacterium]